MPSVVFTVNQEIFHQQYISPTHSASNFKNKLLVTVKIGMIEYSGHAHGFTECVGHISF